MVTNIHILIGSEGSSIAGVWKEPGIFYLLSNLKKAGTKVEYKIAFRDRLFQADSAWLKT